MYELNGILCDLLGHTSFHFVLCLIGWLFFVGGGGGDGGLILFLNFNYGKSLQEQREEAKGWENV